MALICFAVVLVMLAYALIYNRRMKHAFKENRARIADINSQIEDSLAGIRVVKSFGNEKEKSKNLKRAMIVLWRRNVCPIVIWQVITPAWMLLQL